MDEKPPVLMRVRNWDRYENNRSREIKRTQWVPLSNDLSADTFVELVSHEQGAAHLGVWVAVLMVASRARPRSGLLIRDDGQRHTVESLARVTRIPAPLFESALPRLIEIGLLEIVDPAGAEINYLPPQPPAGTPNDDPVKSQSPAAEGKGTEHHHQEGKRKEGKRIGGVEVESRPEESGASRKADSFQKSADDGAEPLQVFASPDDELKALYLAKAGEPIPVAALDAIRVNLESIGVPMAAFVGELKNHHLSGHWENPPGLLRHLSKNFRNATQSAGRPLTAAEVVERDYRCPKCFSTKRGEGAVPGENGKLEPCACASREYITHQRERGIFAAEKSQ